MTMHQNITAEHECTSAEYQALAAELAEAGEGRDQADHTVLATKCGTAERVAADAEFERISEHEYNLRCALLLMNAPDEAAATHQAAILDDYVKGVQPDEAAEYLGEEEKAAMQSLHARFPGVLARYPRVQAAHIAITFRPNVVDLAERRKLAELKKKAEREEQARDESARQTAENVPGELFKTPALLIALSLLNILTVDQFERASDVLRQAAAREPDGDGPASVAAYLADQIFSGKQARS